ncbi:HAD family hydrolase [Paenibacillus athensensis]|uniref:D,D-heptose 1,7-bisphosphate phosphatase n=1 Tax=Paenibacillus athensensis TaxID=1967502 RepID=A0A4Y8Q5E6_9BACL|nr:HAD family hydrolase [Paenibacillus athensensis]MCD1259524.1 HAD family hydrolase [Paenibacillus athensensis]
MKTKALFLDRDGVINVEKNYVHRIVDFEFQPHVFEVLREFQAAQYKLIIITNQAGIAKGYYTEEQFHTLNNWMLERFAEARVLINRVYFCPYHLDGIPPYRQDSMFRKPNPGMILAARDAFSLDLGSSLLVGDQESDIQAGRNAGVKTNLLLATDPIKQRETAATSVIQNLSELVKWI